MIARLLLPPAARGIVVRHRDGDTFNLRPTNLVLEERCTRAKLKELEIFDRFAA